MIMAKGLDQKFLHYGIRKEDLELIRPLCEKHHLDFEWVREDILKKYHEMKVDSIEVSDSDAEKIISDAIQLIRSN